MLWKDILVQKLYSHVFFLFTSCILYLGEREYSISIADDILYSHGANYDLYFYNLSLYFVLFLSIYWNQLDKHYAFHLFIVELIIFLWGICNYDQTNESPVLRLISCDSFVFLFTIVLSFLDPLMLRCIEWMDKKGKFKVRLGFIIIIYYYFL